MVKQEKMNEMQKNAQGRDVLKTQLSTGKKKNFFFFTLLFNINFISIYSRKKFKNQLFNFFFFPHLII